MNKLFKSLSFIISFILVFSLFATGSFAKGIYPEAMVLQGKITENTKYNLKDTVTFIVELEGDAVLGSDDAEKIAKSSKQAEQKEKEVLSAQEKAISSVNTVTNGQADIISSYTHVFNGFSVKASYESIEKIKNIPGVKNVYISEDIKLEAHLYDSVEMMKAVASEDIYYTGKGQLVAVIDTEFNLNHNFFKSEPENSKYQKDDIARIVSEKSLSAGSSVENLYKSAKIPFAYDYYSSDYDTYSALSSHGTHVAGIVGGKGGSYGGESLNGVAPDCQLALMKVASNNGEINLQAMLLALDDAVKLGADIINCSIGADYYSPDYATPLKTGFANAHNAGVFVAVSAGNKAKGFYEQAPLTKNIDYSALGMPAGTSEIMTVASALKTSYEISSFSSFGVNETLELKPEITAPGSSIVSSVKNGADAYSSKSGTSMASPHIAGAAALIYEYLNEKGTQISGTDKILLCQNLMMSTAHISYQPNDVPYSPRVQGAGVADICAAVKTPVILKGKSGKGKISLGDEVGKSFSVLFTAENISQSDASYDRISLKVLTDGHRIDNGKNYVSSSRSLSVLSHTLPDKISIAAKSQKEISASVNLDEAELLEIGKVYTNGFYIDGFVCLENASGVYPPISIPFTGFYGDWTKAPAFDTTIYDESGSLLVKENNGVYETLLYTQIRSDDVILGDNRKGGYSKERIALSPNGDGIMDSLNFQFTPMRTITGIKAQLIEESGRVAKGASVQAILNKFMTKNLTLDNLISSVPDGNYTLRLGTLYNYQKENPTEHVLAFPLCIDTKAPEIIKAEADSTKINVSFRDNGKLAYAYTYYFDGENVQTEVIELPDSKTGEKTEICFDLNNINAKNAGYENIYIFAHDDAENYYCNSLSALTGDIHPVMKDDPVYISGIYSVTFDFVSYKEPVNCTLVLAFYDESGCLIHTEVAPNITVSNGASYNFSEKANIEGAKVCRLFMWEDMNNLIPVDTSKAFDISESLN